MAENNFNDFDTEKEKYKKRTMITPGLDVTALNNQDNVGAYKTETTVF